MCYRYDLGLMMIERVCERCKKKYIAPRANRPTRYCEMQCYLDFRKEHVKQKPPKKEKTDMSFWRTASEQEKTDRLIELYNKHVIKTDDCWDWTGRESAKYPQLKCGINKFISMHRFSWMHHCGKIPNGMFVLHKCDNTRCTNPQHLYLGTQKENNRDRFERKRDNVAFGDRSGSAKITSVLAAEAKKLLISGMSIRDVSKELRIPWSTVFCIKNNKSWRSIPWPTLP